MNGFTRKKVETLTLGERLKKMREESRISLSELSRATGIRTKYLEDIESGKYESLPAEVYVRGFIRSYAACFSADSKPFLRLYDRERGMRENIQTENTKELPNVLPKRQLPFWVLTPRVITVVLAFTLFLGGFVYLYSKFREFVSEPRLTITEPVNGMSTNMATVTVKGTTDTDAHVSINGQAILVDASGSFLEEISLSKGLNTLRVSSINRFEKQVSTEIVVDSTYEPKVEPLVDSRRELHIRAGLKPVNITVKDAGEELWKGALDASGEKTFTIKEKATVSASRGNGVFVSWDGSGEELLSEEREEILDKEIL